MERYYSIVAKYFEGIYEFLNEQLGPENWIVVEHVDDPACSMHGNHIHLIIRRETPMPGVNRRQDGNPYRDFNDSLFYRRLRTKCDDTTSYRTLVGMDHLLNYLAYLQRPGRVLKQADAWFQERWEEARRRAEGRQAREEQKQQQDEVDGNVHIKPCDKKETTTSRKMQILVDMYRQSNAYDANSFKEWAENKGGDGWQFVFTHFMSSGLRYFADAIEVCNNMVDTESLRWSTWLESLQNLRQLNMNEYHSVQSSTEFINRWCEGQHIDVWKLTEELIDICDKRKQKVNSLVLIGQSNAGKTVILNSITEAFRKCAIVTNNSSAQFTWQDAVNQRILAIKEVKMIQNQTEVYKNIMAGADTMVNIKCKPCTKEIEKNASNHDR